MRSRLQLRRLRDNILLSPNFDEFLNKKLGGNKDEKNRKPSTEEGNATRI